MNRVIDMIVAKLFELLAPKIWGAVESAINQWMPEVVRAVVVAVANGAGQVVVDTTDKVTDIIPGTIDDDLIDPIVRNTLDWLQRLGR